MLHQEISIPNHGQSPKSLVDVNYNDKHLKASQYYQNRAIDILKTELSTDAHNTNRCNSGNRVNFTVEDILRENTVSATESDQDSFYVADLGEVERQFKNWQKLMPRVRPYYGIFG